MISKKMSIIFTLLTLAISILLAPISYINTYASGISRDQVEERALKMINLSWTFTKSQNSTVSSEYAGKTTLPSQLKNLTSASMTGIPYNWGGFDGIDTKSYNAPWNNFLQAVSMGAHAGNVNTSGGIGYVPGTAGLDCSGFIQASFNITDSKLSTSTIFNSKFKKVDIKDIKYMDILNKPGYHAVIFEKWGYLDGVYGAYTYESTVDQYRGGIQGAKKYFRSMSEINSGYIAGRYTGIIEAQTQESSPIPEPSPSIKPGIFAQVVNVNEFANFRAQPSTTASIIGTIPKASIIYLKQYSNGWYQISYNGTVGWLYGNLIGLLPTGKYVTLKDAYMLNVREGSSSISKIVTVMQQNTYAEVLGQLEDKSWYKISYNGKIGWASSKYLNFIY